MKKKQLRTILSAAGVGLTGFGVVALAFAPAFSKANGRILRHSETLRDYRELIQKKEGLESEWEAKKNQFNRGALPEEILNAWQQALMAHAQSESLILDKIEPVGKNEGEVSLFLSFQGDMKKLIRFIYHLRERDALVRLKSFSLRQEEGSRNFSFEMILGKAIT